MKPELKSETMFQHEKLLIVINLTVIFLVTDTI